MTSTPVLNAMDRAQARGWSLLEQIDVATLARYFNGELQ